MLILTRKPGQRVRIEPAAALDPRTPIGELFASGPIELVVTRVAGHRVRLGLTAPAGLMILRAELREATRPQEEAGASPIPGPARAAGGG